MGNIYFLEEIMTSGNANSNDTGKQGTCGRPTPIPPNPANSGPNPAGWPSQTGKPSGKDRNNGPPKK